VPKILKMPLRSTPHEPIHSELIDELDRIRELRKAPDSRASPYERSFEYEKSSANRTDRDCSLPDLWREAWRKVRTALGAAPYKSAS
jgi:hypothetical protein